MPATELLPGVQYVAQVWGEDDAQADSHADWVQDLNGGPLEEGRLWTFWTLPDIQVTVKPVQVLEGMALVAAQTHGAAHLYPLGHALGRILEKRCARRTGG